MRFRGLIAGGAPGRTLVALCGLLLLGLAACDSSQEDRLDPPTLDPSTKSKPTVTPPSTPRPTPAPINKIADGRESLPIATVNGQPVGPDQFNALLESYSTTGGQDDVAGSVNARTKLDLKSKIANDLIVDAVLNQAAVQQGIEVSESDLGARFDQLRSTFPDDAMFEKYLAQFPGGRAGLRMVLRRAVLAERLAGCGSETAVRSGKQAGASLAGSQTPGRSACVSATLRRLVDEADIDNHLAGRLQAGYRRAARDSKPSPLQGLSGRPVELSPELQRSLGGSANDG